MALRRLIFDEQVRGEKRKAAGSLIEAATGALKAWRDVVTPHADVESGVRGRLPRLPLELWTLG